MKKVYRLKVALEGRETKSGTIIVIIFGGESAELGFHMPAMFRIFRLLQRNYPMAFRAKR